VEEPAFPMPVQRIVRGIEVEPDFGGRHRMGLEEHIDH
jgi:hypothetical protein